jgi:hypothetical protein
MSVNIFGASGITTVEKTGTKGSIDLQEIEQKIESLNTRKFDKNGGYITGDVSLQMTDLESVRTFGLSNLSSGQEFVLMLGDFSNTIYHKKGQPIEFKSDQGVKFNDDIIMNDCSIGSLREPLLSNECATKSYVDTVVAAVASAPAATAGEPSESIDVSALLTKKLDKTGGIVTGDLELSFGNDDSRTFGVSGISENKIVNLNLGDSSNRITHTAGDAINFKSENGVRFVCGGEPICQFGCEQSRAEFHQNIFMNDNRIAGLPNPIFDRDACTKLYIDNKFVKNQLGYIPTLQENALGKNGFISSASSEKPNSQANRAFHLNGEWIASITTGPIWIQIQCPFPIRIHKIGLKGRRPSAEKVKKWTIQGSTDGADFTDLLISNTVIEPSLQFYDVKYLAAFSYYRLNIIEFEGLNPGLNYFQIYSLDPLD